MRTLEVFNARAFRLALAFIVAIAVAMTAAFAFIYWQVSSADIERAGAILVDEAAKSERDSEAELRRALELRLTRDIRRLDYVALFDPKGALVFGNVPGMPADSDRRAGACRSGTASAGFERQPRAGHLCRPQARRRRRSSAWAEPAGDLRPAEGRCCARWRSRSCRQFSRSWRSARFSPAAHRSGSSVFTTPSSGS